MARFVALTVVAALAAAPAAAVAATNPLLPTPAPQQQAPAQTQAPAPAQTQTRAPVQNTDPNGSLAGWQVALLGLGVVALIGGIWIVIARDAKRATGGRVRTADAAPSGASATRAARRTRKLSAAERRRRKRGRAAK